MIHAHDKGTCAVCDEQRRRQREGRTRYWIEVIDPWAWLIVLALVFALALIEGLTR